MKQYGMIVADNGSLLVHPPAPPTSLERRYLNQLKTVPAAAHSKP